MKNAYLSLLKKDMGAVMDGDKRTIRRLNARGLPKSARLSVSGRAWNIAISPFYHAVYLRSVLVVSDGRNRKGVICGRLETAVTMIPLAWTAVRAFISGSRLQTSSTRASS
ncbi:MAG: hypothetical protein NTV68_13785 [Methanomicrobiales archaeon]|nr:hypothetical protein [Methanomicrobiales archaeon]